MQGNTVYGVLVIPGRGAFFWITWTINKTWTIKYLDDILRRENQDGPENPDDSEFSKTRTFFNIRFVGFYRLHFSNFS